VIEIWKKVFKKVIFRTTLPLLFAVAASCTREGGALRTDSAPIHVKCRAVLLLSLLSSVRAFQKIGGETTTSTSKRKRMKKTFALPAFPLLLFQHLPALSFMLFFSSSVWSFSL
jgi:hypothetical protein